MKRQALLLVAATIPSIAIGAGWGGVDDDATSTTFALRQVDLQIANGQYEAAKNLLTIANDDTPEDPDIQNLLGYVNRQLGDLTAADEWYASALDIDPAHLGALEYQGQLFILQDRREAAEANLAALTELCGACDEKQSLAAALAIVGN